MTVLAFEDKWLETLPPKELGRQLMWVPAKKRLDLILKRADAESVVAAMADQDFFVTVKEVGADDALPLLALGTMDQLSHLFDVEWWRKDAVLPANALEWLERLSRAGEGKLLSWLYQVDFELLTVLFKQWIQLEVAPEDVDLLEARDQLPIHTLDDQFFWECRYPQYENLIQQLLSLLFEAHQGFYLELLNHVIWAVDAEYEESAYRFHRGRLEDRGIPEFYESLDIYRSARPEDLTRGKALAGEPFEATVPSFALVLVPERDLLRRSIAEIKDQVLLDLLRFELASLANKVLVADELPPDQPLALHRAVEKAAATVNLGLALRSGEDVSVAIAQLRHLFMEDLFRLGHARVVQLRSRLQRIIKSGWLSRWPYGKECLDPHWQEWAELLLRKTPQLRRQTSEAEAGNREDFFRSVQDLVAADHQLDVLLATGRLFDALWTQGALSNWSFLPEGVIRRGEDVTLSTMIWTAAARCLHEGEWRVQPLDVKEWEIIWPKLVPVRMDEVIRQWVHGILEERDQIELAEVYLDPLVRDYAREMTPFFDEQGRTPDPCLMKFFLFGGETPRSDG